jgi:uncharacterized protein (TIRG00374 family)
VKTHLRNALGILLSVAFLVWTLANVNVGDVVQRLRESNILYFVAAMITGTLIFPLRARRWRPILHSLAPSLPLGPLWRATAIGAMVSNVVPARAGEIARAYALTKETRVGFSGAFASIAVDRVFDAFVVLALMIGAMFAPSFPRHHLVGGHPMIDYVATGATALGLAVVALYLIVFFPGRVIRLYELVACRVAPRFEQHGRDVLTSFAGGLGVLRHPGRFLEVLFLAVLHCLMCAFSFWLAFKAVGINAPYSAALLLQGLIAIGVSVPSAPGFFGVFEYLGQQGLAIYGVDAVRATSWAIGYHIITFLPITIIGLYYFARLGLHFRELEQTEEQVASHTTT